jgi:PIN domain nuclease of toxin-antitoxin system
MIALDASALLAWLFREPGHEVVAEHLGSACLSAVNLSEVIGRFARDGHDAGGVAERLATLPVEVVPFGAAEARDAAALLPVTKPLGLSLGDRACLALARSRGIPALTADRAWLEVASGVDVRVVR